MLKPILRPWVRCQINEQIKKNLQEPGMQWKDFCLSELSCPNQKTAAQQLIVPIPCRHVSVSVSVSAWADLTLRSPGMEEEIGDNGPGEEGDTSR